jgi:eukaryotic-like serine/threonine-protein kinase
MFELSSDDFPGTSRFLVRRRLGSGSFGVVYEVLDQERHAVVALKLLRGGSGEDLYRFKREFRSLADITHRNLAALYELVEEGGRWFFTMEFVDGVDFLRYVQRESDGGGLEGEPTVVAGADGMGAVESFREGGALVRHATADWERLRGALGQLTEGVSFLHEQGKLHRDIKPSNVMVSKEGRVVVLDFGLATEIGSGGVKESVHLVGTPTYMAPEQAQGAPVTQAGDWYGVGVMLYEALTGRPPFAGSLPQILYEKYSSDPVAPGEVVGGVPDDLNDLCVRLLSRDPGSRPSGREILRSLGAGQTGAAVTLTSTTAQPGQLYGRGDHLARLEEAFEAAAIEHAVTVCVVGGSGMGKSALVGHFLEGLRGRESRLVVLAGRCYEQESVPYKALDSWIDALGQYLKRQGASEAEAILPHDWSALTRLFPVLRQIGAGAGLRRQSDAADPQELRRRAFAGLRELLTRLSDRNPVVLFIDDLQWGDVDSASLLAEVVRGPEAARLLLVAAYRDDEESTSPFLRAFLPALSEAGDVRRIEVRELSAEDARTLIQARFSGAGSENPAFIEKIARESGGNPFFIDELARYARIEGGSRKSGETSLEEVISSRVAQMPEDARLLLEVVSVAGQPIDREVASQAAQLSAGDHQAVTLLRTAHLVRTRESLDHDKLEPYHDRIRETVTASLSASALRADHQRLALAFEALNRGDPETLAVHFEQAGMPQKAASYAVAAGDQACQTLAFEHAARLYRLALTLHPPTGQAARTLHIQLAEALANAGRGEQAAQSFLAAAKDAPEKQQIELQRRAAEQFLISGRIDSGVAVLKRVLERIGMKLAATPRLALLSLILRRVRIRLRGLRFRERDARDVPTDDLFRIDTCWSVAVGLGIVDNIRGADFQAQHLLLALRAGEPYRIARALAVEVGYCATGGSRARRRTERLIRTTAALTERIKHPHASALLTTTTALADFLVGRWGACKDGMDRATRMFRENCRGVAWEIDTAQFYALFSLFYLGDLREMAARLPGIMKDIYERGDLYAETNTRTRLAYVLALAADDLPAARIETEKGIERWSQTGFHLQHFWHFFAAAETGLYAGEKSATWKSVEKVWPDLERHLLLVIQLNRLLTLHLRARVALAAAGEASGHGDARDLLRVAEKDARTMRSSGVPYACALADLLMGAVTAARGGTRAGVSLLQSAEKALKAVQMGLFASAAKRRRGELTGGGEGMALIEAADAEMHAQGVKNAARMTDMLAPLPSLPPANH